MEKEKIEEEINNAERRIIDLKNFLASKDYQTIREMQGGEPMSQETKKQCADARIEINKLEERTRNNMMILKEIESDSGIVE